MTHQEKPIYPGEKPDHTDFSEFNLHTAPAAQASGDMGEVQEQINKADVHAKPEPENSLETGK